MNQVLFERLLRETAKGYISYLVFFSVFVFALLMDGFIRWWFNKPYKRDFRISPQFYRISAVFALILLSAIFIPKIALIHDDMDNLQYIMVETEYRRPESEKDNVWIVVDGEEIMLDMPSGKHDDAFPIGDNHGIVWYAKESEIILSFTPCG